jgi:hypothetical protein
MTEERLAAYRARQKNPVPKWMWIAIGAGMVLGGAAVALLVWLLTR